MLGTLAACVAIFVAYVRAEAKVAGAPQDFCGPMAKPQRMFTMTVFALLCGALPQAWQPALDWAGRRLGLMTVGLGLIVVGGIWTYGAALCGARAPSETKHYELRPLVSGSKLQARFSTAARKGSVCGVALLLVFAMGVNWLLYKFGRVGRPQYLDVLVRTKTWCRLRWGCWSRSCSGPIG